MPELRKDPVTGRWTIFAPDRMKRPQEFRTAQPIRDTGFCPFCAGNESATPPAILSSPADSDWQVRVVPNKFPALLPQGTLQPQSEGLFERREGVGAHEVIIECPHHTTRASEVPIENTRLVLLAYRDRLRELKRDPRLVQAVIFKNQGSGAGASLEHSHSQLIATPIVPGVLQEELQGCGDYFRSHNRCLFCEMIEQELASGTRIVQETPQFVAFCPFASRFAFETWIFPKSHISHFEAISGEMIDELGTVLKTVTNRLEAVLDDPPYNFVIHTAPFNEHDLQHYHWHLEIVPRLASIAGYEWGSGSYINPVMPEDAAAWLQGIRGESSEDQEKPPHPH